MPKNAKSAISSRRSKRRPNLHNHPSRPGSRRSSRQKGRVRTGSALGDRLVESLNEVLAHARGELDLPSYTVTVPERVDVPNLRNQLGLSQRAFARAFGLDVTALHAWEQGRRRPDRAARVLLAVIAKEPQAVLRALTSQQ
jgi:putative transcriptional regulator